VQKSYLGIRAAAPTAPAISVKNEGCRGIVPEATFLSPTANPYIPPDVLFEDCSASFSRVSNPPRATSHENP
jgi:hypothetical protein